MKHIILVTIGFMLTNASIFAQNSEFIKGKDYEGYIFSKEHSIWGFPPEKNLYTPSLEDIAQAEKILKDNIGTEYIKSSQKAYCKPPINKNTLKKYVRQYVGYSTEDGKIVIHIYLNRGVEMDKDKLLEDIISVLGGGSNHWSIRINLSTKELSDFQVNGTS